MHPAPSPTTRPRPDGPDSTRQLRLELAQLRRELAACRLREAAALSAAQIDPLTGLPNRRLFDQQAPHALERHAAHNGLLALLFIDLDDFKAVNDRHGHAVGDALLQLVGRRLRHAMRAPDLVCRVGGDEFVCLLSDLGAGSEADAVQHKLQATIAQPCHLGTLTLTIAASIGSALYPRDGDSLPLLLAHADRAMYHAKRRPLTLVPPPLPPAPPPGSSPWA